MFLINYPSSFNIFNKLSKSFSISIDSSKTFNLSPHSMSMSPFSKVSLESFGSLVDEVAAYLTRVADVETVQFVEPVGDGLAVPAQR